MHQPCLIGSVMQFFNNSNIVAFRIANRVYVLIEHSSSEVNPTLVVVDHTLLDIVDKLLDGTLGFAWVAAFNG